MGLLTAGQKLAKAAGTAVGATIPTPGMVAKAQSEEEIAQVLNNLQQHAHKFSESQLQSFSIAAEQRLRQLRNTSVPEKQIGGIEDAFAAERSAEANSFYPGADIVVGRKGDGYGVTKLDYPVEKMPRHVREIIARNPGYEKEFLEQTRKHIDFIAQEDWKHLQKQGAGMAPGEADAGLLSSGQKLAMDYASRMARARDGEFDLDQRVYHSTDTDFDAFDPDRSIGGQYWSTTNKKAIEAGEVGAEGKGVIKEMFHRIKNPAGWDEYDKYGVDELIAKGYDGLKLPDGDGHYTFVAFEPNQYRDVNAAFDPAKKDSPDLLAGVGGAAVLGGGLLGSEDAEAMFLGPLAKTANKAALAAAEKMAKEGSDQKSIWEKTGWFKGADDKWRFEIDDSYAELGGDPSKPLSGPLEGVIRHDDVFNAYPDMRGIDTNYSPASGTDNVDVTGRYTPAEDRGSDYFPIYEQIAMTGRDGGEIKRGLLHEMQHAIQQREGFALGGSPREELQNIMDRRFAAEERLADVNERIKSLSEGMKKLRTLDNPIAKKHLANYEERYNEALAQRERLAQQDGHLFDDREARKAAFQAYQAKPGEVEARNVEARANFRPEVREFIPPWETEDTTRTKQKAFSGYATPSLLAPTAAAAAGAQEAQQPGLLGRAYQTAGDAAGTLLQAPDTIMQGLLGLMNLPRGLDAAAEIARTPYEQTLDKWGGYYADKGHPLTGTAAYTLPQFLSPF